MRIPLFFFLFSVSVHGEKLGQAEQTALAATQAILADPGALERAASANKGGGEALGKLKAISKNPEDQKLMLELASDILSTIVASTGGDAEKMLNAIADLQRNPASLEAKLTPTQRAKLKEIAKRIEAGQKPAP